MSHVTGTVQTLATPTQLGPDSGQMPTSPNTWSLDFAYAPAPTGTKLILLHFINVSLPANNRLEVDLGYGTDVFTSADGASFWTRPINVYALSGGTVPIRYITDGASTGSATVDQYGRGERHNGQQDPSSISNCDPFLKDAFYTEPIYDPFWFGTPPPHWENVACVSAPGDVRTQVAKSVGMIISVEDGLLSTCSVTLVDVDKVICAGHCHTPEQALSSSIIFGYEVNCDGSRLPGYQPTVVKVKQSISGQFVLPVDYSLLQLATAPAGIPIVQMRHDVPAPGEQVFGIHHPNGAVKKLSIPHPNFVQVMSSNANGIVVPSQLSVSGGSSGSGLFDLAGRITGVLSNGSDVTLSYYPTASILKLLAPTPPPAITKDVMVVFDKSGSMWEQDAAGRTKIDAAKDALSLFVQLIKPNVGNRIGLVTFSTDATNPVDFPIASVNSATQTMLVGTAPYNGGLISGIIPDGATSIGEGLDAARLQFPSATPGGNGRAILLMTDGMENTPRYISQVTDALDGIDIHAIGFGTEANLNGDLLTDLTQHHNGLFTRAETGLSLEKFFSHAFGNIFEEGILLDPEFVLDANVFDGPAQSFTVCGEEMITAVVGWDSSDTPLYIEVTTPLGAAITSSTAGIESATGLRWTFLRISLPYFAERDGLWKVKVFRPRGGGEFPAPAPLVRYFINVVPSGGPRLVLIKNAPRFYTGDVVNPLVALRYKNGSWPENVSVKITVSGPSLSAGTLLSRQKLVQPFVKNGDTIPSIQATLIQLEKAAGKPVITYAEQHFQLKDDVASTKGTFEEAALFGTEFNDLLKIEGNYTFHFVAHYGEGCSGTRELFWTVKAKIGIDGTKSPIRVDTGKTNPDGSKDVTLTFTPMDPYGNYLGPGQLGEVGGFTGLEGTTLNPVVKDNGDGSYTWTGTWQPTKGDAPGLVVQQPGKPPVVIVGGHGKNNPEVDCKKWKWGFWLFLFLFLLLLLLLIWCCC